jgi:hypothetical protein
MALYRKKPVVIDAEEFQPRNVPWPEGVYQTDVSPTGFAIGTLENTVAGYGHEVTPGDWIITGVKGEKYPCKPDIFRITYDEVTENQG